ncbi:MAG: FtsQ-type POTRA domain-containing protein [Armatimonadota bacterium]
MRSHGRRKYTVNKRFNKRPRNRQKPNYILLFFILVVSSLLSGGVSYLLSSDEFDITKISFSGNRLLDSEIIDTECRYAVGQNIYILSKEKLENKILKHSQVEEVKIKKKLPADIEIYIKEKTPVAIVSDGKNFYLADKNRYLFHQIKLDNNNKLPLIELAGIKNLKVGEYCNSNRLKWSYELLGYAKNEMVNVSKISVDHSGNICLNMGKNLYVKMGQPDDLERKVSLLRATLVYRPSIAKKALYIDLSCPKAPVWKPKESEQLSS